MEAAGIRLKNEKRQEQRSCLIVAFMSDMNPLADQTLSELSRTMRSKERAA